MANSDLGHKLTDKELAKLERRIATLYREAGKELQATIDAYFEQFKKRDEEMKALIGTVQNGKEWTEADYKQWRLNQIGRGERYQDMRDRVAHRVTDANAVAVSYTNDATPGIYSLNRNYSAYTIEQVAGNVGFDQQVANAVDTQLALNRQVLGQQLNSSVESSALEAMALARASGASDNANGLPWVSA